MILAGDIGGTKTILALVDKDANNETQCIKEQTFASNDFVRFEDILDAFLTETITIDAACFGIAGPVIEQCCQLTNLPWRLDGRELQQRLKTDRVKILNDMETMAIGMLYLPEQDLIELNPNAQSNPGNKAVIAAGTGLGEAMLFWDGFQYHPIATEGGHSDFAAQSQQQDHLLGFLRKKYNGHVSYERLISGMGFGNIYDFLSENQFAQSCPAVPTEITALANKLDRNAIISRLGLAEEDLICSEVLRLFLEIYGAESGNLALKSFAQGGIYIGGGIAAKLSQAMQNGTFIESFKNKGRFSSMLNTISVKLCLNQKTPLLGAKNYYQ
jgi:glucokinase